MTDLVAGEDAEGLHDLLGGVRVRRLARHKVEEGVERHEAGVVGVHHRHDALEVSLALQHAHKCHWRSLGP